jgi:hypothetical protein
MGLMNRGPVDEMDSVDGYTLDGGLPKVAAPEEGSGYHAGLDAAVKEMRKREAEEAQPSAWGRAKEAISDKWDELMLPAPEVAIEPTPTPAIDETRKMLTEAPVQSESILTPQGGLIDSVLLDFETQEGTDTTGSVEGGAQTMPYGLKDGMADLNMSDFTTDGVVNYKAAARHLLTIRVGQLGKVHPKFDSMPTGLQRTLISTTWNQGMGGAGKLRSGLNEAMELPEDKQSEAVKNILNAELLDGISANDPRDGRDRPMVGLMKRKAEDYNLTATQYGFPTIQSWDLVEDVVSINGRTYRERATYFDAQGNEVMQHRKQSRKHSKSGRLGSFEGNTQASVDLTNWDKIIT